MGESDRWADLTDDEQRQVVDGWNGEVQEHRMLEPGTITVLDIRALDGGGLLVEYDPDVLPTPFMMRPFSKAQRKRPPRKVCLVASDVWEALGLLGMESPSSGVH